MSRCQALTHGGGMCGRLAGLEMVMVRGPGFRFPERRLYCARCRGEEVRLRAPAPDQPRPTCQACDERPATPSGVCYNCWMVLVFHAKHSPHRIPTRGTKTRAALEVIRVESVRKYKHGAAILALRARLSGGV